MPRDPNCQCIKCRAIRQGKHIFELAGFDTKHAGVEVIEILREELAAGLPEQPIYYYEDRARFRRMARIKDWVEYVI